MAYPLVLLYIYSASSFCPTNPNGYIQPVKANRFLHRFERRNLVGVYRTSSSILCPHLLLCCNFYRRNQCFIFSFTHCIPMEFKSALWQCDVHDFDVIVELSEESFGTQYRHGPLSVTWAGAHLRTLHSKSQW